MVRLTADEKAAILRIEAAIDAGNSDSAREMLRGLLNGHPDNPRYWYLAAQVAVNDRQREHFLEKAIEIDPLFHKAANQLHRLQNPIPPSLATASGEPYPARERSTASAVTVQSPAYWRRGLAFIIDSFYTLFVFQSVMVLLQWVMFPSQTTITSERSQLFVLLVFGFTLLAYVFYQWWYLTQRNGQTLGKRITGLQVIRVDNHPLTLIDVILRSLIGYALSTVAFGLGYLWSVTNPQQKTWHDLLANTRVIQIQKVRD